MAYAQLESDKSYHKMLSSETKPADDKTVVNGVRSDLLLEVDTATWYVFYNGTWYAQ